VPDYLSELCIPFSQVAEQQRQPPTCHAADSAHCHAVAVVCPTAWNALSNDLRNPDRNIASSEDAFVPAVFNALSALEALYDNALDIN